MSEADNFCTCWLMETQQGQRAAMGWLRLHDSVRVVLRDGSALEGWTCGVNLPAPGLAEQATVSVESSDGEISFINVCDIATVSPASGTTEIAALLSEVEAIVHESRLTDRAGSARPPVDHRCAHHVGDRYTEATSHLLAAVAFGMTPSAYSAPVPSSRSAEFRR